MVVCITFSVSRIPLTIGPSAAKVFASASRASFQLVFAVAVALTTATTPPMNVTA
jgi:hypothetical protein